MPAVEGEDVEADVLALGHEDGGGAVGPAAAGQDGVFDCGADVAGDDGVEAEGFSLLV